MEKTKEGQLGRLTIFGLCVILAVYVGYGIYNSVSNPLFGTVTWGVVIGPVVGLVIAGVGWYYSMVASRTVSLINETEGELRKVIWPKSKPFAASTELWQYTIAVIVLMVVLVAYIAVIDSIIGWVLEQVLFIK